MRVQQIDTAEVVLALSPEDCLLLTEACLTAGRCNSGGLPAVTWSPLAATVFETMATVFILARSGVRLRQALAAGDPPDEDL